MSWRVVVIESQSKLDYKMGYLVVRGLETKRVLLDEIAVLLIENPAVSMTGVFGLFSKRKKYTALKVGFVLLNAFLLLPYAGHVLNGFSYVSNRWIWAYGMLIAYIFVKIYPELFTLTLKEKRKIFEFIVRII